MPGPEANARILLIDDDVQLCAMLAELLRTESYDVQIANDGKTGLNLQKTARPDLVILDVMMPAMDGMTVLRRLRDNSSVPVLMLTARGEDSDRIAGLELGADDYLAKPFHPRELLLRIRAILKRSAQAGGATAGEQLSVGQLSLDPGQMKATVAGKPLLLTGAEFRILEALMRDPGQAVSREYLTEYALGREHTPYDRSLDTHISHLRSKIGKNDDGGSPVRSVRGSGYLLVLS